MAALLLRDLRCPSKRSKLTRIVSPYDVHARNVSRRGSGWDGSKVHFSETCDPEDTGRPHLVTEVVTTDATVGGAVVVDQIHDRLEVRQLLPGEYYMGSGCISAELLLTTPIERGAQVIGPVRPNSTRENVEAKGFGTASFTVDWTTRHATCPNGRTSQYWAEGLDRNNRPAVRIRFATKTCAPCADRDACTRSTWYGGQLTIRPQEQSAILEQVRADQNSQEWKAKYAIRTGVEGTIHQAIASTGCRRTRYRSLPKTRLAHVFTAAAINLIRIDAWWSERPLASTRTSHLARIQLAA